MDVELVFGCAPIMGRVGRKKSLRALNHAFDSGIYKFDIARSYGFGMAENVMAEFSHKRRYEIEINSKVGILPKQQNILKQSIINAVRPIRSRIAPLKSLISFLSEKQLSRVVLTKNIINQSLETSLKNLNTDYLDCLYLHDPVFSSMEHYFIINEQMHQLETSGKILKWGIAAMEYDPIISNLKAEQLLQLPSNLMPAFTHDYHGVVNIATMPYASSYPKYREYLDNMIHKLNSKNLMIGLGITFEELALGISALQYNRTNGIVTSMFSTNSIDKNIRAVRSMFSSVDKINFYREVINGHSNES